MQAFKVENLPKDWKWTPIGEIADAVRGVAFPGNETSKEKFEKSIACLTTSGVQEDVNWSSRRFIPKNYLSNEKQILKNGDLLVSTANSKELVGKSCLIKKSPFPCTFGAFVTVLRPNAKIDSSLFAYWMKSNEVIRWCFQNSSNTTNISNLRTSELLALEIPLPKLDEQKRIASILDKADRLRRQRRYSQTLSDSFLQSVFIKMFGDPAKNPLNWTEQNLRSVSEKFSDGPFGSNLKTEHYTNSGIRVIRLQNIGISDFIDDDKAFISEDYFNKELSKHRCLPNDVIIGTMGDPNLRACILPKSIPEALNKADCIQFRPKKDKVNTEFICWLLNMPSTLYLASGMILGQTRSRISMGRLAELYVPIPPLPLQEKFAEIVQKFERVRRQQREATRQAEHLFQTLLHRAFRGEL